jgi:predicted ester cyclase
MHGTRIGTGFEHIPGFFVKDPPGRSSCGFSKLDPREFIGGFDRLRIVCVHGGFDKRSVPGCPKGTPDPHRTCVGNDRAAPSNCHTCTKPNSLPVLPSFGTVAADFAVELVAGIARKPDDRPAGEEATHRRRAFVGTSGMGGAQHVYDQIRELTKRIVNVFVTGDLSDVSLLVAADYVDHQGLSGVEIFGPAGFARVVTSARASCGDLRVRIEDLLAAADKVSVRLHWRGTLLVGSPNADSMGKGFDRETIDIIRFENGQMVEHWGAELWVSLRPRA